MNYYTALDIKLITGRSLEESTNLIKEMNKEIKNKYKNILIKPYIDSKKIESKYFIERMENYYERNIGK